MNLLPSGWRPRLGIFLPSLVFFLTGAAAVYRQAEGYRMERELSNLRTEVTLARAVAENLDNEIEHLCRRERVLTDAARLGLSQPGGDRIVILHLRAVASDTRR